MQEKTKRQSVKYWYASYIVNDTENTLVVFTFAESIIPSSGVFVVKLAKRGAGLGITISCKLPLLHVFCFVDAVMSH